jgi:hypothetical protein
LHQPLNTQDKEERLKEIGKGKKRRIVEEHQDPAEYFLTEVHSFGWWG